MFCGWILFVLVSICAFGPWRKEWSRSSFVVRGEPIPLQQTNLLFIMFDDLRPELSVYGKDYMITPNFDRLASQSVVFDHTYVQIAVCNPSRDSLLTGLRPDTVGTYAFQSSFRPFRVFPTELVSKGYLTAGIGKILHWEAADDTIWNFLQWDNDWYGYQHRETNFMNSSTMPDRIQPEHKFRDHLFADKTIEVLHELVKRPNYFMLSVGFKLPHLAVHVPYRYYNMYKNKRNNWRLSKKELRYPLSSPDVSYRCCANPDFEFMNNEGALKAEHRITLGNINFAFSEKMHDELMLGYCAGVSFVDYQLGRILDEVDKLHLWDNITIVLTSDHGMHNGEKGMWEKWTLFDESSRVPLIMYHPQSPHRGQHFKSPVELVDVYPTIRDIIGVPGMDTNDVIRCPPDTVCKPLQGKSLAHIVLGNDVVYPPKGEIPQKSKSEAETKGNNLRKYPNIKIVKAPPKNKNAKVSQRASSNLANGNEFLLKPLPEDSNPITIPVPSSKEVVAMKPALNSESSMVAIFSKWLAQTDVNRHLLEDELSNLKGLNSKYSSPQIGTTVNGILQRKLNDTDNSYYAISQSWRCADRWVMMRANEEYSKINFAAAGLKNITIIRLDSHWQTCDVNVKPENEVSVMGYSMRTAEYRYTAWFNFNRQTCTPNIDSSPLFEEFYDHRGERLEDFTHMETRNVLALLPKPKAESLASNMRSKLVNVLKTKFVFRGCFKP